MVINSRDNKGAEFVG